MNIPNIKRISALLEQFNCTPREAQIYLQSLQTGPATVQELARLLDQNRVTIHSAVEQLIAKGFLYETRKGKRRLIGAEDPSTLLHLLQKKQNELDMLKHSIEYVAKLLSSIQQHDRSMPTVKFYEGVDGLKKMLEETLSAKNEVLVFTYVDLFAELLSPRYLENYYRRRAAKDIHARLIFPFGEFGKRVNEKAEQYRMRIRFLPPTFEWKSGIFSWNNVVAIQSFTEGKITCTIIENKDIAHFYRTLIYELCWNQAQALPSKTKPESAAR